MTAVRPEPHQDQDTISSFKRTFNAAVLLRAAQPRMKVSPGRGRGLALGAALIAGPVAVGVLPHVLALWR